MPEKESDMPVESCTSLCVFSLRRNYANYFLAKPTTLHAFFMFCWPCISVYLS